MTCSLLCVGHAVWQAIALPFGQQSEPPNSLLALRWPGLFSSAVVLLPLHHKCSMCAEQCGAGEEFEAISFHQFSIDGNCKLAI